MNGVIEFKISVLTINSRLFNYSKNAKHMGETAKRGGFKLKI